MVVAATIFAVLMRSMTTIAARTDAAMVPASQRDASSSARSPVESSVTVFAGGECDTTGQCYSCFRIPALKKIQKTGTLVAFAEARRPGCSDHGDVRIVMRASADNGATWSNITQVVSETGHTIGNPSPVVDQRTGVISLPFSRDNDQAFLTITKDEGRTWSPRVNQTSTLKKNARGAWYGTGPAGGVQADSGKLVTATCENSVPGQSGLTKTCSLISSDGGSSWKLGSWMPVGNTPGGGEPVVTKLGNGTLVMLTRTPANASAAKTHPGSAVSHAISFSQDDGSHWSAASALFDIRSPNCQGSVLADGTRIFVGSPCGTSRSNFTLFASDNYGQTFSVYANPWPGVHSLAAYSSLEMLDAATGRAACLYERGTKTSTDSLELVTFDSRLQLAI